MGISVPGRVRLYRSPKRESNCFGGEMAEIAGGRAGGVTEVTRKRLGRSLALPFGAKCHPPPNKWRGKLSDGRQWMVEVFLRWRSIRRGFMIAPSGWDLGLNSLKFKDLLWM